MVQKTYFLRPLYFLYAFLFQINVGNTGTIQKVYKCIQTVTEVTRISVQPLYFINHTPTVLYNQKYKEYEITKNVEISTK